MMMLVTKDSEDEVDLDQEVAYHVCVASRARRADVWRVYAINLFMKGPDPRTAPCETAGAPPCAAAGGGAAPRARSESLRNYGERRQPPLETLRNYGEDPRFRFS